jgi:hypothetical protein
MNFTPRAVEDSGERAGRTRTLRRFGLVMAAPLVLLALLLLWKQRPAGPYVLAAAACFALLGAAAPRMLDPVEKAWMTLAAWLSVVMTYVVLTLAFFLVVTPLGLMRRLFGGDSLRRRFDGNAASYWVPVDPNGPAGRHDRPY